MAAFSATTRTALFAALFLTLSCFAAITAGSPTGVAVSPSAPQGVTLSVLDDERLHLAWVPPSTDGGSEVTSYSVEARRSPPAFDGHAPLFDAAAAISCSKVS